MDSEKIEKVHDLIDSGMVDMGRNEFILNSLQNGKKLYNTDAKYLENQTQKLNDKIISLQSTKKIPKRAVTTAALSDKEIDEILERQDRLSAAAATAVNTDMSIDVIPKPTLKSKFKKIFRKN